MVLTIPQTSLVPRLSCANEKEMESWARPGNEANHKLYQHCLQKWERPGNSGCEVDVGVQWLIINTYTLNHEWPTLYSWLCRVLASSEFVLCAIQWPPYVHLTFTSISRPLLLQGLSYLHVLLWKKHKVGNKATKPLHTSAIMHTCICQKIKRIASWSLTNLFLSLGVCYDVQIFEFHSLISLCLSSLH